MATEAFPIEDPGQRHSSRGSEARDSDARGFDARDAEARDSDARDADARGFDARDADARGSEARDSDARPQERAADELIMNLERDQFVAETSLPVPRAALGAGAAAGLWALRIFVVLVSLMVVYTFVDQLH